MKKLSEVIDDHIRLAYAETTSVERAAKLIGVGRATMYRHLYRLGLLEKKTNEERNRERSEQRYQRSVEERRERGATL